MARCCHQRTAVDLARVDELDESVCRSRKLRGPLLHRLAYGEDDPEIVVEQLVPTPRTGLCRRQLSP